MGLFLASSVDVVFLGGVILLVLVNAAVHEGAHAAVAWRLGDRRPEVRRRASLNLFRHIDPVLTIAMPVATWWAFGFPFGGAKPVLVDARLGAWRLAAVSLAGPLANFVLGALVVAAIAGLLHAGVIEDWNRAGSRLYHILSFGALISGILGVLNLIPFPPFDGARIVAPLLPPPLRALFIRPGILLSLAGVAALIFVTWKYPAEAARAQGAIGDVIRGAIDGAYDLLRR